MRAGAWEKGLSPPPPPAGGTGPPQFDVDSNFVAAFNRASQPTAPVQKSSCTRLDACLSDAADTLGINQTAPPAGSRRCRCRRARVGPGGRQPDGDACGALECEGVLLCQHCLADLHELRGDDGQDLDVDAIELVQTTPSARLNLNKWERASAFAAAELANEPQR